MTYAVKQFNNNTFTSSRSTGFFDCHIIIRYEVVVYGRTAIKHCLKHIYIVTILTNNIEPFHHGNRYKVRVYSQHRQIQYIFTTRVLVHDLSIANCQKDPPDPLLHGYEALPERYSSWRSYYLVRRIPLPPYLRLF